MLLRTSAVIGLVGGVLTACGSPAVTEYRAADASRLELSDEPLIIERYRIKSFALSPEDEAEFRRDPAAVYKRLLEAEGFEVKAVDLDTDRVKAYSGGEPITWAPLPPWPLCWHHVRAPQKYKSEWIPGPC